MGRMSVAAEPLDVLVVGAGLSGLALAWHLQRSGRRVLVCEATERVGGAISSELIDGFTCEGGPNSFQSTRPLQELLVELQLEERLVFAEERLARFVWWENRLRPVPMSPAQFVRADLLSWPGKLRCLSEFFVPPLSEPREETVAEFVLRRFGDEALNRLIEPFIAGVFAGDAGQLSADAALAPLVELERQAGSVLRGLWQRRNRGVLTPQRLCTLRGGIEQLPRAIARRLQSQLRFQSRLEALEPLAGGWQAIVLDGRGEAQAISARSVALAAPAWAIAPVLARLDPSLGRALESIYYPPVAAVSLGYSKSQLPNLSEGFGHLIPRGQSLRSLGVIYNSCLFRHAAPTSWRLFTCFLGGTTDPLIADLSDGELANLAHRELQAVLDFQSSYQLLRVARWPRAIPQYALGHITKQERIERYLAELPGLFLVGNYFGGISVGDCVRQARLKADSVLQFLTRTAANGRLNLA
ncbi:protoporphyrinogen oxidase [Gloeobacter kilaueensis JS1]|uniref:Coproporphyrinogen III oxidase n=2 Tax=Gloeobacter TaxID=33071 RepID=U5QLC1_GLOK1|nr:protoporphyrinogen oxidase [Gloeobacter kilaueensis JS1]